MKEYFYNLWMALTGRNPLRGELESMRAGYEQTAGRVDLLEHTLGELQGQFEGDAAALERAGRQIRGYERLVDNLRGRIREKDLLLAETRAECQARISECNNTVDRLKAQLEERQVQKTNEDGQGPE